MVIALLIKVNLITIEHYLILIYKVKGNLKNIKFKVFLNSRQTYFLYFKGSNEESKE